MKLNSKRTICVGFAFFLICAFWQAYDNTIPLILTNKFGMSQTWSGLIMALDNILALFMLPLFGAISDKCKSKRGRRTPFILIGTIAAAVAFFGLSVADSIQLNNISKISAIDDPESMAVIYEAAGDETLMTPGGQKFVLSQMYTEDQFCQIKSEITVDGAIKTNPQYTDYVVPARQAVANQIQASHRGTLILFVVLLMITLIAMATFRSPAVALMPDVTIKPLRSKANAVINLMGALGGIIILALGKILKTGAAKNALMSYMPFFGIVAGIMLIALFIFMKTVDEPRFVKEMEEESARLGIDEKAPEDETPVIEKHRLTKEEKKSLLFLLLSIVLWFFGYNAVTSKYSVYATNILHKDYNMTLIIAQAAAIVSYIPVGMAASKVGRKKTILAGIVMLAVAFGLGSLMNADSPTAIMYAIFALAGIGWATINVNSFPMVVEMCSGADVGKYTGFYYTASMAAQSATPLLSGFLMDKMGMKVLFPYATVFVALAFVTMLRVRHGDNKPKAKVGLEAFEDMDD